MNGTITLHELATAIEEREARKRDLIVSPRTIEAIPRTAMIDDAPRLAVPDHGLGGREELEISDIAHDQIAGWSPIGRRYYRHMLDAAPDLWAENVNHWFTRGDRARMLRLDGDNTRAFLSDQYGRFEDIHLLRPVLEKAHGEGWEIAHCALTDRRMHIRVTFPFLTGEVKVGEAVRAGAAFTNSEVGFSTWKSEFYLEVLSCLNGQTFRDMVAGFSRRHLTSRQNHGWLSASTLAMEDELLQAQVADTLVAMTDRDKFDRVLSLMRGTTEQEIEHPTEAVKVLAKRANLSQDEQESVVREQIKGGDPTLWGLVNAMTATARDLPSFERRAELEDIAGRIIATPKYQRELVTAEAA